MKKLYLTVGISGAGKSTYLKKHFKPEIIVTPDNIRKELAGDISNHTMEPVVWATAHKRIQNALDKYGEAVLDATNVNAHYRAGFLKPYKKSDIEKIAIVFPADANVSKQRVQKDLDKGIDRSRVPPEVIDRQFSDYNRGYAALKSQFDKVIVVEEMMKLKPLLTEYLRNQHEKV